jgi:hypothetical protein
VGTTGSEEYSAAIFRIKKFNEDEGSTILRNIHTHVPNCKNFNPNKIVNIYHVSRLRATRAAHFIVLNIITVTTVSAKEHTL